MPSPSTSQATLRPDLGGSLMEFDLSMADKGFIANRVLPVFESMKQSGPFGKIPIEQLLQSPEISRAPGAGYSRTKFTFDKGTFACEEFGVEEAVDDRESEMYRDFFDAEQISTLRARHFVELAAEMRAAALLFNATTWTSNKVDVTHEWDDAANAVPMSDVETAVQAVFDACGLWPNALIVNRKVFRNLRLVDEIQALSGSQPFMDVRPGMMTAAHLATVFDLEEVIVAGAPKNSAIEGAAASIASVWSDEYAMVARVARSQDIREPCVGRTIHWGEDGSSIGGTVESYREEGKRSEIIRVRHDVDEKVLYMEAAQLITNVTTI